MAGQIARTHAQLLVAVATASWLFVQVGVESQVDDNVRPSGQADTIGRISEFVFIDTVTASAVTKALDYRRRGYSFETLDDVNLYNSRSADVLEEKPVTIKLPEVPLESLHWWSIATADGAALFIQRLTDVLANEVRDPATLQLDCGLNVLVKALCQRDLVQTHGLVTRAHARAADEESKLAASALEQVLLLMIQAVLLSEEEYASLRRLRPSSVPSGFSSTLSYSLSDNYLPRISEKDGWAELADVGTSHFEGFGGRSFIKVYARAPLLSRHELLALWDRLFDTYGEELHLSDVPEGPHLGFETMLVRSFGVFLRDGSYRDSSWPEEIALRVFKYENPTVDLSTSDFRGTLVYLYRMSRRQLLADPPTLGLKRIGDDDAQFFGFFGDVPDRYRSYSATLTTMRSNCVLCHSELHYGLSTVFSFERNPSGRTPLSIDFSGGKGETREMWSLQQELVSLAE